MTTTIISMLALTVSATSVLWTVWYNKRQTKVESIQQTRDLFMTYYSLDMLRSRDKAWFSLDSLNQRDESLTFSSLWTDLSEEAREEFDHIQHVLEFWFQLYALDKRQFIDRKLAIELFEYHYGHWRKQFRRLVEDTAAHDQDCPYSIHAFSSGQLEWLIKRNGSGT